MSPSRRPLVAVLAAGGLLLVGCSKDAATSVQAGQTDSSATAVRQDGNGQDSNGQTPPAPAKRASGLGKLAPAATPQYLTEVVQRTGDLTSGEYQTSVQLIGSGTGDGDFMKGAGKFDNPSQTSQSSYSIPGLANLLSGYGGGADLGGFSELLGGLGEPSETITKGSTVYVKTPKGLTVSGKAVTTPWVKIDSGTGSQPVDLSKGLVPFAGGSSPKGAIAALQGSGADLKEVGTETLDGVSTHHFTGTFDLAKAAAAADPSYGAELKSLGGGNATIDVWVDDDGIVRKQDIVYDFSGLGALAGQLGGALGDPGSAPAAGGGKAKFSIVFSKVNQPVDITIPTADQVTPATAQDLGAAGGGLGGGFGGFGPN